MALPRIAADWLPHAERRPNLAGSGGSYTGGPPKLVWHTFETTPGNLDAAIAQQTAPGKTAGVYHVLADTRLRRVAQVLPFSRASSALRNGPNPVQTNRDGAIQVCLIARAADVDELTDDDLDWLADAVVAPIKVAVPELRLDTFVRFYGEGEGIILASSSSRIRLTIPAWDAFAGALGHQHVPDTNDHWDPGALRYTRILDRLRATGALTPQGRPQMTTPLTSLDLCAPSTPGRIRLVGWAYDPDDPARECQVHVYSGNAGPYTATANVDRPDVRAAFGIPGNHGFDFEVPAVVAVEVRAFAIDAQDPAANALIGVRQVNVPLS